jgi:sortase A
LGKGRMMRGLFGIGLGRVGLLTTGAIALVVISTLTGRGMLTGADAQPAKRVIQPIGMKESAPEPVAETESKSDPSASVPAGTLMSLSVPALGISEIPVVEGTSEASLSQGAGHLPGTGYPWVPGSNTYIAGHRIGYPGTLSDHVFWNLPTLGEGDEILLTDSNGTTYTYAVSEVFEVSPTDLSVTAPTGRDVVSLQTCIEDFGDYWSPGPNWYARYIVRGTMV